MPKLVPDEYEADTVFATARRVVYDRIEDRWTLQVNPKSGLVGKPVGTPIEECRENRPSRTVKGSATIFEGPMLFSAGVITLVGGQYVLLYRGSDAPTAPEKWTSPAGRGDHDPGMTALKEFYEELLVLENGNPVFIHFDDRSPDFESIYMSALRGAGVTTQPSECHRIDGATPERYRPYLSTVVTEVGDERYTEEMLVYHDESANTLELRFVIEADISTERVAQLTFHDGELNREVRRFSPREFMNLGPEELVSTDAYFASEITPEVE